MSPATGTDEGPDRGTGRSWNASRAVVTVGIVLLAFAALWFVVNLLYALL